METYEVGEKLICKSGIEVFYYDDDKKDMCKDHVKVGDIYMVEDLFEHNPDSTEYNLLKIKDKEDEEDFRLVLYNDSDYPWIDLYFDRMR